MQKNDLYDAVSATKMMKIFQEYNFFDLCRAVFCINSWRYNRPHLQFYLTLNYALCITKQHGSKKISCYEELDEFFEKIKKFYSGIYDDEIIPDFGEIKIAFNNKYYPVYIGTGHNLLFPFMESLDVLSKEIDITNEMEKVLIYVESMINIYQPIEPYNDSRYSQDTLSKPSQKYFDICCNNYSTIADSTHEEFYEILTYENNRNLEESHFIKKGCEYLPLFNPSIIIDAFNHYYNNKTLDKKQKVKISNYLIYDALYKNYDITPEQNKILTNTLVLQDINNKKILDDFIFEFTIVDDNSLLFLINGDKHLNSDLNKLVRSVEELLYNKNLKILEPDNIPRYKLFDFSDIKKINFIVYNSSLALDEKSEFYTNINQFKFCQLYDLISLIYQSQSSSQIVEFFDSLQNKKIFSPIIYNGYSALFDAWIGRNKEFSQGAENINFIYTDVYLVEWNIFDMFVELNLWYPFSPFDIMFNNVFSWAINKEDCLGFRKIISRSAPGFGGDFRKINNSYLFLAFNMTFERDENYNIRNEAIKLIEELMENNLIDIEKTLIDSGFYSFNGVQITYMPKDYAKTVDNNGFLTKDRDYVYSDTFYNNGKIFIRFAVNEDKLFQDILKAKDRTIECQFIRELLLSVKNKYGINFDLIEDELESKKKFKKNIETIEMEMEYVFSNKNLGIWPTDENFVQVRKQIAFDCKMENIKPGKYSSNKATEIIRKIQTRIIPNFENIVSKYNQISLHKQLLSIASYFLHNKKINYTRYGIMDSDLISDEAKQQSSDNIIKIREESKDHVRVLNYLIDINLSINHNNNKLATSDDLLFLIAYAHWLLVIQDCSDETHYNLFESQLEIEDDYLVSTIFSERYNNIALRRNKRIYDNIDYKPNLPLVDSENFHLSTDAFYKDINVRLDCVIQLCNYFAQEFSAVFNSQKIPDVYEIDKEEIIKDFTSILSDKSEENINNYINALNYLIIDTNKIKTYGGVECEIIPIWEREQRDNRFEVRPIVEYDKKLIFSPVVMHELKQLWEFGIFNFYPPYEYGLPQFRKCLDDWKSIYEKQMEIDIENLFLLKNYKCKRNLFLHKIDKAYGHPKSLGDYDIVAIDEENKTIWNLESKFLAKTGSIKEYYNHQDSFFNKDKKDEKFLKRIQYLNEHKDVILKYFNIDNDYDYKINSYMITNKVFTSDLKEINFEIITFFELKKLLNL